MNSYKGLHWNLIIAGNTPNPPRPRFNSCQSEPRSSARIPETGNGTSDLCSSVFSSTPSLVTTSVCTATNNSVLTNGNTESMSEVRNNLSPLHSVASLENGSSGSYLTTATTASLNGNICSTVYSTTSTTISSSAASLTDKPPMIPNDGTRSTSYRDQPASSASPPTRDKLRAEDKARRRMNQQGERTGDTTGTASGEKLGWYIRRDTISPRVRCLWQIKLSSVLWHFLVSITITWCLLDSCDFCHNAEDVFVHISEFIYKIIFWFVFLKF